MKILIKKEIRLLLPAWTAAMVLAIFAPWILPNEYDSRGGLIQFLFPIGVLILGITSFGQEFNSGGISNLLGHPLDRHRIWRTKTAILALGFLFVCCAGFASFLGRFAVNDGASPMFNVTWAEFRLQTLELIGLSAIVTFSGGLWTSLLLRQMTGAFWLTLLIPMAVIVGVETLLGIWIVPDWILNAVLVAVLTIYSVVGFFLARWLFFHAQDTQWAGGNISFAWRAGIKAQTDSPANRPGTWASALVLKEIHVHQVDIFIAGILLALQLSCLGAVNIFPHLSAQNIFALKSVWILWSLMPLLIGSSAIAEERRLGVMETQLCLPASRTAQWFAKLSVALLLSLLFGGLVPFAVIKMGGTDSSLHLPAAVFVIYPIAISLISTYASSLVRATLLAIGTAMAIIAILWSAGGAIVMWNFGRLFLGYYDNNQAGGLGVILLFVGLPVLLAVLIRLTYSNFIWLHEYSKLWRRNIIVVFVTVLSTGIFTNALYFRAWEFAAPIEPAPGPVRLDGATNLKFGSFNSVFAVLPDGRIWSDMLAYRDVTNMWWQTTVLTRKNNDSHFIGGSNWVDVAVDNLQLIGIHSDGTLWSIQRKWNPSRSWWRQSGPVNLAQIGSETDWVKVAGGRNSFMLLKRDGSLWRWGTNDYDWKHEGVSIPKKLELDRAMTPSRVGAETDWLAVLSLNSTAYAKKRDGSLWQWAQSWDTGSELESGLVRVSEVDTNNRWSSIAFYKNNASAQIKTNGEFWLYFKFSGSAANKTKSRDIKIRLGENAKWRICGNESWDGIWAIRADGTLWKWPPVWNILDNPRVNPIQLGSRSDWLELSDAWQFGISLAADGSVWAWNQPSRHIWLAPSLKPLYLGNIFEATGDAGQPAARIKPHENAD